MWGFAGLPLHPLLVHIPVVLVPTTCVLAVGIASWPTVRQRLGVLVLAMTLVSAVSAQLAVWSGRALHDLLPDTPAIENHRQAGETSTKLLWLFAALLSAYVVVARRGDRSGESEVPAGAGGSRGITPTGVLAVLVIVGAIATSAAFVRTGHLGATAVWGGLMGGQ